MTELVIVGLSLVIVLMAAAVAAEQRRAERMERRVADLERALGKFSTGSTPGGKT